MIRQDRFVTAQRKILAELEDCELAAGELYAQLGARLPDMADFWDELARQERSHAALLHSMDRFLNNGMLFQNLERFDFTRFRALMARLQSDLGGLAEGELTPERALSMALSCERTTVEAGFFRIVESDAPAFQRLAGQLAEAEHEHARRIERRLLRLREFPFPAGAGLPDPSSPESAPESPASP